MRQHFVPAMMGEALPTDPVGPSSRRQDGEGKLDVERILQDAQDAQDGDSAEILCILYILLEGMQA
jgi:hypothetical protein